MRATITTFVLFLVLFSAQTNAIHQQKVFADLITGVSLDAKTIVNSFNSLNGGTGIHFNYGDGDYGAQQIKNQKGYTFADTGAYDSNRGTDKYGGYLWTFCVEPAVTSGFDGNTGKLNYNGSISQTSAGKTLTVGAACLYALFATDQMLLSNQIGAAVRFLIGDPASNENISWDSSAVLRSLLKLNNDTAYWQGVYDPDSYYTEIGNYSVFVLDVRNPLNTRGNGQDHIYVANAANPYVPPEPLSSTPEPATLLTCGLGLAGAALTRSKWKIRKQ